MKPNFFKALGICKDDGAQLAALTTREDHDFLLPYLRKQTVLESKPFANINLISGGDYDLWLAILMTSPPCKPCPASTSFVWTGDVNNASLASFPTWMGGDISVYHDEAYCTEFWHTYEEVIKLYIGQFPS